ncbi:hypothetical protein II906_04635 [bacterium]|nr:hypothetical protein [bacterium]
MPKKKNDDNFEYSKNASFENLKAVQEMALNRKGKDDEINPDISVFLKAEELKGKLCGLYSDKDRNNQEFKIMDTVKIDGKELNIKIGEDLKTDSEND